MKIFKKLFNRKNFIWFVLGIAVIMIIIFFSLRRKVDEIKIENHDLYQYLTGIKIEYTGRIKINKEDNSITKIAFKDESVILDSTPIYYKDDTKVIFPEKMIVLYPFTGQQFKINYFTTIYRSLEDTYIKDGKLEKKMNNSVIYDGNDLYFLTTTATVRFEEQEFSLNAMSYIIVDTLNSQVQIYNKEKDEFLVFDGVTDEVIISNSKIKVNATLDLMYYNGKSRLILKDIDKLKKLK